MRKLSLCILTFYLFLVLAFTTHGSGVNAIPYVRTNKVLPIVRAPPSYPTGIKQYEGVLVEADTSKQFNVMIYVNFDDKTVIVSLLNDTGSVLEDKVLSVKRARNKTLPWGPHLFFRAISPDRNTKLMVNQLKWFTLCHIVDSGTSYVGLVSEKVSL